MSAGKGALLVPCGLAVHGLHVTLGGREVLRGVDLEVAPGELVGLVGPNGAGKTTLLRAVAGFVAWQAGTVEVDGGNPRRLPARALGRLLAHVPQTPPLGLDFSCLDVVLMGRYPHQHRLQRRDGARDLAVARKALAAAGLAERAADAVGTLSGGQRQRLMLARALAQEAGVLLLDEPTANLDLRHRLVALESVRAAVRGGIAALAAVHDLELAARYCERLVLLAQGGVVVATGSPTEVLTPAALATAFGVRASTFPDPFTGDLRLSVSSVLESEEARTRAAGAERF